MSIENLFGGIVASNDNKLSGSGQNPTAIGNMGNSAARIKERMVLPTEISANKIIQLEKELGQMDGELELGKAIVSKQKSLLNKAVDLHNINTEWASVTMEADQRLREIESKHKQTISRYMLGAAETQAYVDGYTEAYKMSAEIFS
nr:hypothetical protein [Nostoc sp. EkiNYC01]